MEIDDTVIPEMTPEEMVLFVKLRDTIEKHFKGENDDPKVTAQLLTMLFFEIAWVAGEVDFLYSKLLPFLFDDLEVEIELQEKHRIKSAIFYLKQWIRKVRESMDTDFWANVSGFLEGEESDETEESPEEDQSDES